MSSATLARDKLHDVESRLDHLVGGPARRKVVLVLAGVLALDSADMATIGTSATQLQHGLHIGVAQIGLLISVTALVGAVATVPAGMLIDRVCRTRLLAVAVLLWGAAGIASGFAPNYTFLVIARVALGIVVAVRGPGVASLVGDYFPEHERGRIYGFVLSGELIGAGFGFLVSGQFAQVSWRAPFFILALPSLLVWWALRRLPEPARGGGSRIPDGAERLRGAAAIERGDVEPYSSEDQGDEGQDELGLAHHMARERNVTPRQQAVLRGDPHRFSLWDAVRYVLRVRTNVVLIIASALGYFFFSGVRGFAFEFAKKHYGVSQSVATMLTLILGIGALVGILIGGRLADKLLAKGRISARVVIPGIAVLVSAGIFVPALTTTAVFAAVPLLFGAALFLGMANPPLDAARLDIIHSALWGRAEAIRSVLRSLADAAAPVLFGVLAGSVFGGKNGNGLRDTFVLMLISLVIASVITLVFARRTYPCDVAAAAESMDSSNDGSDDRARDGSGRR